VLTSNFMELLRPVIPVFGVRLKTFEGAIIRPLHCRRSFWNEWWATKNTC